MKIVGARISANIPEALAKRTSDLPSDEELSQMIAALLEWAGYTGGETHVEESNKTAVIWSNVAVRLAYEMLPCFHAWRVRARKNKGGRPAKDTPAGLFGIVNPHKDLILAVQRQQAKAVKAGERGSVKQACKALSAKQLPTRYHNLTAARLVRLYYQGKELARLRPDVDRETLARGFSNALDFLSKADDREPPLTK